VLITISSWCFFTGIRKRLPSFLQFIGLNGQRGPHALLHVLVVTELVFELASMVLLEFHPALEELLILVDAMHLYLVQVLGEFSVTIQHRGSQPGVHVPLGVYLAI